MIKHILILLTILALFSCQSDQSDKIAEVSKQEPENAVQEIKNSYSKGFKIVKENNVKKLIIFNPFEDYNIQQTFVLLKKNQSYTAKKGETIINIPIQSVIPFSSSYISMIDTLGNLNSIVAIENKDYVYNKKVLNKVHSKLVKTVGNTSQLDLETIITLKPDVMITIGNPGEEPKQIQKLTKIGIPQIINYDWKENHPLGKAEWIKFFGALYNKETEANAIFETIESNYNQLKHQHKANKPDVLFSSPYNGTWYIPGGNSYASMFVKDAGGTYPWINDNSTGSLPLSFETIASKQSTPDIWLNPNYNYLKDMTNDDNRYFLFLKAVKGNVYHQNKRITPNGGNDYWERGTLRPDLILKDYIELFKMENCNEDSLFFFKKIQA